MSLKRIVLLAVILVAGALLVWSIGFRAEAPSEGEKARTEAHEAAVAEPPAIPSGPIDYRLLDQRFSQLVQQDGMAGLAVGIVENGQVRFVKGYGETVAGSGEPVTAQTIFRWASLSKGVAGNMVALLAHQNKLSLYEPINRYSSTLRLPGGNEASATISDLLSHRLGLFAHAQDAKLEDGIDPAWLRASLATVNNICPPGSCHAYQNVAFDAASEIVQRVTGQPYPEAVRQQLFLPLGMTTASMTKAALISAPSWARPHVGSARPMTADEITEYYYRVPAAGGVNGSIMDLALWMRGQMNTNRALPPEVLQAVQTPRANTPGENARRRKFQERTSDAAYGLGWRIFNYAGNRAVGHHGGVRGYRSLILFDPVRKSGVVALWNSSTAKPNGLEYEVMDMIYGLPFRDWLQLGDASAAPAVAPAAAATPDPANVAEPAAQGGRP